jgi:ferric iron reductase protein FhuF
VTLDPAAIVGAMLPAGPLVGTGRYESGGRVFVRDSCCLLYRVPNSGKCGDCVLL